MKAPLFFSDMWTAFRMAREARSATSTLTNPQPWLLAALGGGPTKSGASVNENTAFNVAVVRTCVGLRANLMAMLPIKVFQKSDSGPKEQRDHPLAKLFRGRVSPGHTRFKWVHCTSVCEDLGGNGYARIYRNSFSEVERIVWKKPADVVPLENKRTDEIGWRVYGQGDLFAHEILHIANLSTDGRLGRSPLHDLRETVGLSMTAEEFSARSFVNGNRQPGVLVGGPAWTNEKAKEFIKGFTEIYGGAHNAGKNPMVWGGATWENAGFSNADAELLGTRKFSKEEISGVYQIPLHLVNSTEKSVAGYGANVEQVNQGLVDYMLAPRCANWEAEINTTLLTEREQEEGFYVKFWLDALLRGSPATRAAVYQIMRNISAISVNEIRGKEDMELLTQPDGIFDDPRLPLNTVAGTVQKTDPAKTDPANAN